MQPVRKGRKWSTRGSVPSFDSDSLQQLAFPDDSGANDAGPAKEDTSHVARRRLPSEPAHELDVDEVELLDEGPIAIVGAARLEADDRDSGSDIVIDEYIPETPNEESRVARESARQTIPSAPSRDTVEPSSLAPLAMDREPSKAPFDLPLAPPGEIRPRSSRPYGLLVACSLMATVVAGGLVVRRGAHEAASSLGAPSFAVASDTKLEAAPATPIADPIAPIQGAKVEASKVEAPKGGTPNVEAKSAPVAVPSPTPLPPPPHATTGTIVGLSDHRLWIDGALVPGFEATVRCGKHQVQVGSAGAPRTIDVPCGDAVKAQP